MLKVEVYMFGIATLQFESLACPAGRPSLITFDMTLSAGGAASQGPGSHGGCSLLSEYQVCNINLHIRSSGCPSWRHISKGALRSTVTCRLSRRQARQVIEKSFRSSPTLLALARTGKVKMHDWGSLPVSNSRTCGVDSRRRDAVSKLDRLRSAEASAVMHSKMDTERQFLQHSRPP